MNLKHAGFVKQPYGKFENSFLDSLISQNENVYRDLRRCANLSRKEMAELAGVSEGSIRRYESHWKSSNPPKWYYLLLRLVNGDLSFFGGKWNGCIIQHHDRKFRTHFVHNPMEPREMFTQYNRNVMNLSRDVHKERLRGDELETKLLAYEAELAKQRLYNEMLSEQYSRLKLEKSLTEKGKVIPLFAK